MMTMMVYHGNWNLATAGVDVDDDSAATATSEARHTPNPGTTAQLSVVATQVPPLSVVVELQLRHALVEGPEHVSQPLEHLTQAPFAVSKYSSEEQVRRQVEAALRTGREGGHDRHWSKEVPHVWQSG